MISIGAAPALSCESNMRRGVYGGRRAHRARGVRRAGCAANRRGLRAGGVRPGDAARWRGSTGRDLQVGQREVHDLLPGWSGDLGAVDEAALRLVHEHDGLDLRVLRRREADE